MKNYERLDLKIENLTSSDVIATSTEVTTEEISVPWNAYQTE